MKRRGGVRTNCDAVFPHKLGQTAGALSKFGVGEIDNQWFRHAILTIVPRPFEDRSKIVPRLSQDRSFFGYASDNLLRYTKTVRRLSHGVRSARGLRSLRDWKNQQEQKRLTLYD